MFEFWLILFIIIEINILKEMGIAEKSVSEQENIYQTFLRVIIYIIKDEYTKIIREKLTMISKKTHIKKLNNYKRILKKILNPAMMKIILREVK